MKEEKLNMHEVCEKYVKWKEMTYELWNALREIEKNKVPSYSAEILKKIDSLSGTIRDVFALEEGFHSVSASIFCIEEITPSTTAEVVEALEEKRAAEHAKGQEGQVQ